MSDSLKPISNEICIFLRELQKELLSQPTDGNRSPRFWTICDTKRVYGFTGEDADGWEIFDSEAMSIVGEANDIQSVIQELTDADTYGFTKNDFAGCDEPDEIVDRFDELLGDGTSPLSVARYREESVCIEDRLFLTKKACQEHIKKYRYNYKNPRTFVMTAERSPEFEQLLKILETVNWNSCM
ncbi:MAG: hypothetical protein RR415_14155 [Ruthenibacterium sp.]